MLTLLVCLLRPRRGFALHTMAADPVRLRSPKDVLDFWFGDRSRLNDKEFLLSRMKSWYGGPPEFEHAQRENTELMDAALRGELVDDSWRTPAGLLAQIILADQFPRMVYKASAQAFSGGAVALSAAHKIIENNWFVSELLPAERLFVTMPLLHSEDLADHELLASLFDVMSSNCPEDLISYLCSRKYATDHIEVIRRFGRFPSRNAALGRVNTPEEEEYLSSPDLPGWAKSQIKK